MPKHVDRSKPTFPFAVSVVRQFPIPSGQRLCGQTATAATHTRVHDFFGERNLGVLATQKRESDDTRTSPVAGIPLLRRQALDSAEIRRQLGVTEPIQELV
jgi:hypothetical protein